MQATEFSSARRSLHQRMADAYQKFLHFVFVQNVDDHDLQLSMAETRIKFLSTYFATHAPVAAIFDHKPRLMKMTSMHRRYLIADYFSREALLRLRRFPAAKLDLAFEHVIPKDALRQIWEGRARHGADLLCANEIKAMLDESWHIAVITKEEDRELNPQKKMPAGWEKGDDVLARYRSAPMSALRFDVLRANEDADECRRILATEN